MTALETEKVRIIVGYPENPGAKMIPITIHDMDSRRLRCQYAHRDQLAVMAGDQLGEWMAIWLPRKNEWALVDYVGDMKSKNAA
jgi:hypothetical protein